MIKGSIRYLRRLWHGLRFLLLFFCVIFLLSGAVVPVGGFNSQVRSFTRPIEFDFGTWTLDAIAGKLSGWGLNLERFMTPESQSALVPAYLEQLQKVRVLEAEIFLVYSDPNIQNPDTASQSLRDTLQIEQDWLALLTPAAEAVLQTQLMDIVKDSGLDVLGQVLPPSLYRSSDVPKSLVISPRSEILQEMDVALMPEINTEAMDDLENSIFQELNRAALVVPIGGIGTYPTMVMETTDLVWLTEVIAHEWVHNFLTLRPLGINYFTSAELRTINETTADLAGKELGRLILEKYYPDRVPPEIIQPPAEIVNPQAEPEPDPFAFDFRAEMRITRVEVDRLLGEGEVEQAESYMESRRQFFWENGFLIRKLNQAYFAFYGAYNAAPGGGAAGEDPVGPAVTAFRAQFDNLADFLNAVSWVVSFDQLLGLLEA